MKILPILNSDAYKQFHQKMYPKDMITLYSNMTPRKSRLAMKQAVWFGLNYYLKEYLIKQWNELFFKRPIADVLAEYKRFHRGFSFCEVETEHIEKLHALGYMPLKIKALPEGSLVNMRVPFYTIVNTHPEHAWLVNFLETQMSTVLWDMVTVATMSFQYRILFSKWALKTTGSTEGVQWQGHDFAMRGRSSIETSYNQAGHLLSFTGTDTIPAVLMLEAYYGANLDNELIGASVPASEHSVMTSYGKEDEVTAFARLLHLFPKGILSVVSDSFDLWKVLTEYIVQLKEQILERDGKLVLRPDSGDPIKIIAGWKVTTNFGTEGTTRILLEDDEHEAVLLDGKYYKINGVRIDECGDFVGTVGREISEVEIKGVVECLWDVFGGTINEHGYRVLDSHIGCIYGDSITLDRAEEICSRLEQKGFASTNWVAGIGSYTFNYNTRDTLGIAVKSTYCEIGHPIPIVRREDEHAIGLFGGGEIVIEGVDEETQTVYAIEQREIFKDPITDDGTKKSAKGLLRVDKDGEGYYLTDQVSSEQEQGGELVTVFEDGELLIDPTLSQIRERINEQVNELLK